MKKKQIITLLLTLLVFPAFVKAQAPNKTFEQNEISSALMNAKRCAVYLSATFRQKKNGAVYTSSIDFIGTSQLEWEGTKFKCMGSSNDGIDSIATIIIGTISANGKTISEGTFTKDRRSLEMANTYGTANWKLSISSIPYSSKTSHGFIEYKLKGKALKAVLSNYVNKFYSASYSYSDEAEIVWSKPVELSIQFWK